jgi:1-aminocyclopropane-1-carboxylate deaminase/D-cysteine desulfhydrase-like pyridoxal-dependent ACC family enzyme
MLNVKYKEKIVKRFVRSIVYFCVIFLFLNSAIAIPLFEKYPKLQEKIKHISLASLPTPVYHAQKMEKTLGIKNLFIKRDDLCFINGEEDVYWPGGNKIRKLEFLLADAIDKSFENVITVGGAGSNHALSTAVGCKKLGLNCKLMLSPQLRTSYARRNLLLDRYFGAEIFYFDTAKDRNEVVEKIKEEQSSYFIPVGGSNEIGCLGYLNAVFELYDQIKQEKIQEPDVIYVTAGSAGTAAGILLGLKILKMEMKMETKFVVVPISGTCEGKLTLITNLVEKTSSMLHNFDETFPVVIADEKDVDFNTPFLGVQYACVTPETADAIKMLYDYENIKLDGTYAGKTFSALISDAFEKKISDKTVFFWNTFCAGDFSIFVDQVNYKELPDNFHCYFKEPLQELDQGVC